MLFQRGELAVERAELPNTYRAKLYLPSWIIPPLKKGDKKGDLNFFTASGDREIFGQTKLANQFNSRKGESDFDAAVLFRSIGFSLAFPSGIIGHSMQDMSQRKYRTKLLISVVFPLFFLAACSIPRAKVAIPSVPGTRASQTGIASWYGPGFHGKATASGTIYDQNDLTAAHQTLPLGSRVLVTNLQNGNTVEITVNDRGPFAKGRILDLSYAAGRVLGMIVPGTIPVRLEVIESPYKLEVIRSSLDYTLQIGSFSQRQNAQELRDRLAQSYSDVIVAPLQVKDATYYRVQLGTFSDRAAAEDQARHIAQAGYPVIVMEK
jgi:rare lipoprotein A